MSRSKVKGQGHQGQKTKSATFCLGAVLGARSSMPVGKSAHAV